MAIWAWCSARGAEQTHSFFILFFQITYPMMSSSTQAPAPPFLLPSPPGNARPTVLFRVSRGLPRARMRVGLGGETVGKNTESERPPDPSPHSPAAEGPPLGCGVGVGCEKLGPVCLCETEEMVHGQQPGWGGAPQPQQQQQQWAGLLDTLDRDEIDDVHLESRIPVAAWLDRLSCPSLNDVDLAATTAASFLAALVSLRCNDVRVHPAEDALRFLSRASFNDVLLGPHRDCEGLLAALASPRCNDMLLQTDPALAGLAHDAFNDIALVPSVCMLALDTFNDVPLPRPAAPPQVLMPPLTAATLQHMARPDCIELVLPCTNTDAHPRPDDWPAVPARLPGPRLLP